VFNQLNNTISLGYNKLFSTFFYTTCLIGVPLCTFFVALIFEKENHTAFKLMQENQALLISNEEKNLLIKEIHHRVKNNLQIISSLVNLQINELSDPQTIDILNVTKNRIFSLSLIHQKLFTGNNVGSVNLIEHINDLINFQKKIFFENIQYSIVGPTINLSLDIATPLSLITSELLINMFKHAFKQIEHPQIDIIINPMNENNYELRIKDNGVGLPENFNLENSTSLGMEIIKLLAKQIDSTIKYTSSNTGTEFRILFCSKTTLTT